MKIIIAGDGKVGSTLSEHLSNERHDVTILDLSDDPLQKTSDTLDVMCIRGNSASIASLREAGADRADLFIAVTSMDEVNMISCLLAKRLGAKHTIARVRNVEYNSELLMLKEALGIDTIINPERTTAVEISRLLRFPSAANIDTFFRGRVELVGFIAQGDDFIVGKPLSSLSDKVKGLPILFCAAERGEDIVIPDGSFVPQQGDMLYLVGSPLGIHSFFRLLSRYIREIKEVFIIGGGRITHYLSEILLKMGMHVKLVERSEDRCRQISEELPQTLVICGDGTDQSLLESEHFTGSDAFVALTNRDEDNLLISLYARHRGISKVIAKSNRQNYNGIARLAGLESVVSPKFLTANYILQLVRGMQNSKGSVMTALYRIAGNKAEAMEFMVNETTRHLGVPLRDLSIRKGILIAAVVHRGLVVIPEGSTAFSEGDTVIIISKDLGILDLNDIYEPAPPAG